MHAPRTSHLRAVRCILQFIKCSLGKGTFHGSHGHLKIKLAPLMIGSPQLGIVPLLEGT